MIFCCYAYSSYNPTTQPKPARASGKKERERIKRDLENVKDVM